MASKPETEVHNVVISQNRKVFVSVWFFSCFINILMLTGPIFMLQVYDRVIPSSSVPTLIALGLIVFAVYTYYGVLEYIRSRIMVRLGRRIEERLRARVFDTVATLALSKTGQSGNQPISDLGTIRQYMAGTGPTAYLDMPWVVIYLAVVFLMHWILGVVAAAAAVVIFVLAILTEASTRGPTANATRAMVQATLMAEETRRNAEAVHSLGMKSVMRSRWIEMQGRSLDFQTRANDAAQLYGTMSRVFRLALQSAMLGTAAYLAIKHEISAGSIVASSILMGRALAPIEQAVGNWQQFLSARKAYERLSAVLESVKLETKKTALPAPKGLLEAESLAVVLPGSDKPIFQGVSFKVQPGKGLGIIGPTGAGKSTLARILVGLVPATRGAVRLDGATPEQRSSDERGRLIGYMPQDTQIFDGTVAQNIARFTVDADEAKIIEAAKFANIHDFIVRLPQGYDTQLNEGGSRLSSGQRQRVALARALFGDPVVLIMDEPNSNLDVEGEKALDMAIRATLQRGASVIVVAHRPSALQAMSDLLVLANGQIAAYGPRDDVLKKIAGQQQQIPPPSNVTVVPAFANPQTRN